MALQWPAKDTLDTVAYSVDWTSALGGATILASSWQLLVPAGTNISGTNFTTTEARLLVASGTVGQTAQLTNTIMTSAGETLVETIYLPIFDGATLYGQSTVLASTIVNKVRNQLIDTGTVQRWTDAELLGWLTDGQRTIVAALPDSYALTMTLPLAVGTRQYLPTDGQSLLRITRNLDGSVGGRAVRVVDRDLLDTFNPSWHEDAATTLVKHYMYDPTEPTIFYVYPPNDGTGQLELRYSGFPPDVTAMTTPIVVDSVFQTALIDYVLYRAYQKDSDFEAGMAQATNYYAAFMAFLQARAGGKGEKDPNTNRELVR